MRYFRFISTTAQAQGAISNGTVVRKINSGPGDAHLDGSLATVTGSVEWRRDGVEYAYFVEWFDNSGVPVGITGHRIELYE